MTSAIHVGDCRDVMRGMEAESFVACVTDPPYGLSEHRPSDVVDCLRAWLNGNEYEPKKRGFMGKSWDGWVPGPTYWREAYRVLKPGGHLVCFAGTRTSDLMGIAIRLAGFEVRDQLLWIYGSGFPKSHNLDGDWDGYGSALKPSFEPVWLARKPLTGTIADNVQAHGCGALNIAACRIAHAEDVKHTNRTAPTFASFAKDKYSLEVVGHTIASADPAGRWPANLLLHCECEGEHDPDCAVAMLDAQSGELQSGVAVRSHTEGRKQSGFVGCGIGGPDMGYADTGGASRFFFTSKASRNERERGLEHRQQRVVHDGRKTSIDNPYLRAETKRGNTHPCIKPVSLMRWLVRLVGGKRGSLVLDPFCGSGSTGVACELEGFSFTGIDLDPDHCAIARARILSAAEEAGTATAEHIDTVPERQGPVQLGLLETTR